MQSLGALAGSGSFQLEANSSPFARGGVAGLGISRRLSLSKSHPRVAPAEISTSSITGGGSITGSAYTLTNGVITATVTENGLITHLASAASGRNVIPPGSAANLLRLHHDLPTLWDAWDLDAHYARTVTELAAADSHEVQESDEAVSVVTTRRVDASTIVSRVTLRAGSAALDIEMEVDWHESEKVLKLAFPLDVHADRVAAETQFGHVFRSTHVNTSWDAARFEACQHRWLHIGEPGFGVGIANDSTYGYDVDRTTRSDGGTTTTARFTLLRAPRFPDPQSDQGRHLLRFRIAPDAGIAETVQLGYELNLPARVITGEREVAPLLTSSTPAIVIEAIKLADDRSGDLIVRVYESLGTRASGQLVADFDFESVVFTDLLERVEPVETAPTLDLMLRPFQLRTLRFSGVRAGG